LLAVLALLAPVLSGAVPSAAQQLPPSTSPFTYADLVDLSEQANLVVKAKIRKQATVSPENSPGLLPGHVRLYLEAETQALLAGSAAIGQSLRLLADLPLDSRGRPPKLKDSEFIFFGREVPGRPGELQLLTPDSYSTAGPDEEARIRAVLREVAQPEAPPHIEAIREAISIAGNLAGESETQLFLETAEGTPVSLTVMRRPGMAPQWGVAWSELVDQSARPPERETLAWYRLACFLPSELPASANISDNEVSRRRALEDYQVVMSELGPCKRNRSRGL
ncbi:MAG TPA: hypothetical protein VLA37_02550, partial [Sphingomonadaceae bacterium]|nr:hypothetical protein [Sphingomonadaceae bacterium]